jgi:hypothetical protein
LSYAGSGKQNPCSIDVAGRQAVVELVVLPINALDALYQLVEINHDGTWGAGQTRRTPMAERWKVVPMISDRAMSHHQ